MTLTDVLLLAALAVFVLAWWIRRTPARRIVLVASAVAILIIGIVGYLDNRWQNAAGILAALIYFIGLGVTVLKNRRTKTDVKTGVPFITGSLVTLTAVGPLAAIVLFPVWPLPKPSGQYAIGVRSFELTDAARSGVLMAKPDEPRRLLVRIWYPAQTVTSEPAPYFSNAEAKSTALSLGELVGFPSFFTYVRHVKTNSHIDAPLLEGASNLPVVFYSHGYTSFLNQNTVLMEHLASHGYVVVSIQHTFDSSATAFPNGDVAPMDPALFEMSEETEAGRPSQADALAGSDLDSRLEGALAFQEYSIRSGDRITSKSTPAWVADRLAVHDALQNAPPQSVADIARASNWSRVAQTGMSFGGAVTGEICMIDPRCAAGINLDGGNFPFSSFNANIPVPFLMFHSDMGAMYRSMEKTVPEGTTPRGFNEFSYERIADAGKRSDVYRVQLKGSEHLGLSDFSLFVGRPLRDPLFGNAPAEIIIGAQNDFVLGFLDKHLRGATNDFPAGPLARHKSWVLPTPNTDLPAWWNAKPEAERASIEARIATLKPKYAPRPEPTAALP